MGAVTYENIPEGLIPFVNDNVISLLDGTNPNQVRVRDEWTAVIFTKWLTITVHMTDDGEIIVRGRPVWHSASMLKLCKFINLDAPITFSKKLFVGINSYYSDKERESLNRAVTAFSSQSNKNFYVSLIGQNLYKVIENVDFHIELDVTLSNGCARIEGFDFIEVGASRI